VFLFTGQTPSEGEGAGGALGRFTTYKNYFVKQLQSCCVSMSFLINSNIGQLVGCMAVGARYREFDGLLQKI
jgi:hypothetical protein